MFSQALALGNSKNEIRQRNRVRREEDMSEYGENSGQENKKSRRPNCDTGSLLLEAVDELPTPSLVEYAKKES